MKKHLYDIIKNQNLI